MASLLAACASLLSTGCFRVAFVGRVPAGAVAARRRIAATFSYMSVFVAVKALRKLAALREFFAVLYLVVDQEAFGDKAVVLEYSLSPISSSSALQAAMTAISSHLRSNFNIMPSTVYLTGWPSRGSLLLRAAMSMPSFL